ncbi:unnamed protein product [Adineta steineri]|uniref:EF-hand domain-containing protein n=1 Tax=Adineta steineri TaxID=433720 RepID=A0A815ZS33_9BILA|nr:unnamed protein product [Adineta steineri]CAF1338155.1 unnamed protein product [Adineta steineri]CAF1359310.1 unnamed protein product [Adineta steineri]CAF1587881.1 unnamed protein product [Adineta steineri]CAF1591898.1 unnamed protein product [Adineta steineri]
MDILRRRLLDSTTKQSDLIEIFTAIDRDCSGRINFEEFRAAIKLLQLNINSNEEIKDLFQQFDTTHNGQIDLSEFLQQLKPPMNDRRQKAALNLFNSIDVDKDGRLTITDIKAKYAAQLKPTKNKSSQSIDNALKKFLNKFDTRGQEDGIIDQEEFLGFCAMLSATVKEDVYFEHTLRTLFDFRL